MLDPDLIGSATKSAPHLGSEARTATTGGFLAGVPGMDVDASSNNANVVAAVGLTGQQMHDSLSDVRNTLEEQLKTHQDMQRARRTFDYQPDMNDLRPTDARGYPKELPDEFYAPFKRR